MTEVLEILLWTFFALVFYAYLGYGIVLFLLVKMPWKRQKGSQPEAEFVPQVSLVVAAWNEVDVIHEKIANCRALDYPAEKLQLIFVTDGSDDGTPEAVAAYPDITLMHDPERKGKIAAIRRVMPEIKTPITIFTDANAMINREAIRNLVRHFVDEAVGAVAGEKRIKVADQDAASGAGEGLYWKYESKLKQWDAELYSVVGAAGELFAIRTSCYEPVPEDTLIEDFVMTMNIAANGYRVKYAADAYALEAPSASSLEELKRKIRIAAGGLQAVWRLRKLLNPFRYGWLSFQYVSHRVLRWTLAPLGLVVILLTNILLASQEMPFYKFLLVLQAAFYGAAALGWFFESRRIRLKPLFIPFYFCLMNYAVFAGFFRLVSGRQSVRWERAKRG